MHLTLIFMQLLIASLTNSYRKDNRIEIRTNREYLNRKK